MPQNERQEIVTNLLDRKKEILKTMDSFRQDLLKLDRPARIQTFEGSVDSSESLRSQIIEKEKLLKELDQLRLQNQILQNKAFSSDELEAQLAIARKEAEASKEKVANQMKKILDLEENVDALESTISVLKDELITAQANLQACRLDLANNTGDSVAVRKLNNSERLAMINQQQALLLEIEKLKTDQDRYRDLITNIEAAVGSGKICLMSGRGLKVTTMMELATEIRNFK